MPTMSSQGSHRWSWQGNWNFHSKELSFLGTFVSMSDFKGELSWPNISYYFLHTYTCSVSLTHSFTHAEQGSQVCRPTHLLPSSPHMLGL